MPATIAAELCQRRTTMENRNSVLTAKQQELVIRYIDLPRTVVLAMRRRRGWGSWVDQEELEGVARLSLVKSAADCPDTAADIESFPGLAASRMRWDVLEALRSGVATHRPYRRRIKRYVNTEPLDGHDVPFVDPAFHQAEVRLDIARLVSRIRDQGQRRLIDGKLKGSTQLELSVKMCYTEGWVSLQVKDAVAEMRSIAFPTSGWIC